MDDIARKICKDMAHIFEINDITDSQEKLEFIKSVFNIRVDGQVVAVEDVLFPYLQDALTE